MRKPLILISALCVAVAAIAQTGFRHYEDENDRQQLAMEGKAPPPIVSSEWLNSKPLSWKSLKGKVVLLDMWAYW
jgi:hypothetical protein